MIEVKPGERYGCFVVLKECESIPYENSPGRRRIVLCKCDCGTEKRVGLRDLRSGATKSCGCFSRRNTLNRNLKHGHSIRGSHSSTYKAWAAMMTRCNNPNSLYYENYGGRGIRVCDRWRAFENFLADMGECPEKKTLDRLDNDKDYEPGNCRWATRAEQNRNQKSNLRIEFRGETMLLVDWAKRVGVNPRTLKYRIDNWGIERALTTPKIHR